MKSAPRFFLVMAVILIAAGAWFLLRTPDFTRELADAIAPTPRQTLSTVPPSQSATSVPAAGLNLPRTTVTQIASSSATISTSTSVIIPGTPYVQTGRATSFKAASAWNSKALHFAASPAGAEDAIFRMLTHNPIRNRPDLQGLTAEAMPPLPIYRVMRNNVASLNTTPLYGYLYVIESNGKQVAFGEGIVKETGDFSAMFVGYSGEGGYRGGQSSVAEILDKLATMPEVNSGSFDVRFVDLPGGGSGPQFGIWLKSNTSAPDLIYRIPTVSLPIAYLFTTADYFRPAAQKTGLGTSLPPAK